MSIQPNELSGRRPLKTRDWKFFQLMAAWLAKQNVSPNAISVWSVVFGALAGIALACTSLWSDAIVRHTLWLAAAAMIQMRLIANLLDGMVAIEGGKKSIVGELYNEVPDRISDPLIFIGAGLAYGSNLPIGMLAAIMALFVAYVRAIGASVGVGQIFMGPFAKQQRMALLIAVCIVCTVLPDKWQPIHEPTSIGLMGCSLLVIAVGSLLTSIRRLRCIAQRMHERAGGES